jgi:diacylglycerol kinase
MNNMINKYVLNLFRSILNALQGIKALFMEERNAQFHLMAAIIVVTLSWYFKITKNEWISILLVIGMVLLSEAFNTAIEEISDFISPEYNEKIGKIKDLSAGAVLISSVVALIIGLIIFAPRLSNVFQAYI